MVCILTAFVVFLEHTPEYRESRRSHGEIPRNPPSITDFFRMPGEWRTPFVRAGPSCLIGTSVWVLGEETDGPDKYLQLGHYRSKDAMLTRKAPRSVQLVELLSYQGSVRKRSLGDIYRTAVFSTTCKDSHTHTDTNSFTLLGFSLPYTHAHTHAHASRTHSQSKGWPRGDLMAESNAG